MAKKDEQPHWFGATFFQWVGLVLANVGPIKALLILILGTGTIYGNDIGGFKSWIHKDQLKTPAPIDEPTDHAMSIDEQQNRAIGQLVDEYEQIKADIKKLQSRSYTTDKSIQEQIDKWHGRL